MNKVQGGEEGWCTRDGANEVTSFGIITTAVLNEWQSGLKAGIMGAGRGDANSPSCDWAQSSCCGVAEQQRIKLRHCLLCCCKECVYARAHPATATVLAMLQQADSCMGSMGCTALGRQGCRDRGSEQGRFTRGGANQAASQ
mgnify:CR=1 FL=1